MSNIPHLNGKGFSGRHTTAFDNAAKLAQFVTRLPNVKSVTVGPLRSRRGGNFNSSPRVKIIRQRTRLNLVVSEQHGIQDLFVHLIDSSAWNIVIGLILDDFVDVYNWEYSLLDKSKFSLW